MFKYLIFIFDRILAVCFALLFSQAPLFIQQYKLELIGHSNELQSQVSILEETAKFSNKSLEQYIEKFISSTDHDFVAQGQIMQNMVAKWVKYRQAIDSLNQSSPFQKPFAFLAHLDLSVIKNTFEDYQFGLPLTLEGGIYALIGVLVAYCFVSFLKNIFSGFYRLVAKAA